MKEESPNEFRCLQRLGLKCVSPASIAPLEGHLAVLERYEAVVADGDAVRIAPEIAQDMGRRTKGGFGIDDPVLLEKGINKALKALGFSPRLEGTRELELPLSVDTFSKALRYLLRKTLESALTGKRKSRRLVAIHRSWSGVKAPPVTTQWTWMWDSSTWFQV